VIADPEGGERTVALASGRVTIGRLPELNDIALEPDPQLRVSRQAHCLVERAGAHWWVTDNGSTNGTFLRRRETAELSRVDGRAQLASGDRICIQGTPSESGERRYWTLTFSDPLETTRWGSVPVCFEYDRSQGTLYRVERGRRVEVGGLRPLEHKLVRYMAERTRAEGGTPALCSYEELIEALWGEEAGHTPDEVTHLVWGLRRKIEPDRNAAQVLETARGRGYRLRTCLPSE
jgi:DNA-binding winged helix-turn-helix (wHTH) protein